MGRFGFFVDKSMSRPFYFVRTIPEMYCITTVFAEETMDFFGDGNNGFL